MKPPPLPRPSENGPPKPPPIPPQAPETTAGDPPSLSYFVPPPPIGWAIVGAFSASEWHAVRVILSKRNIMARIGNAVDETGHTIELLVPIGNETYARSLLAGGIRSPREETPPTSGFPVVMATPAEPAQAPPTLPFADPIPAGLTPSQVTNYNIVLVLAWILLIFVLLLIAVPILLTMIYG
jgi:hypothetical protein